MPVLRKEIGSMNPFVSIIDNRPQAESQRVARAQLILRLTRQFTL